MKVRGCGNDSNPHPRGRRLLVGGVVVALATAVVRQLRRAGDSAIQQVGGAAHWPPLLTAPATTITAGPAPAPSEPASPKPAPSETTPSDTPAQARVEAPWVIPMDGQCPESHPVKANASSSIYHVAGGQSYDRTKAERCYCDGATAEADGFRRAKR
jgi:hypothetical protein